MHDGRNGPSLEERVVRMHDYQHALAALSRAASESLPPDRLMHYVTAQVSRVTHIRHVKVMRYRPDRGDLLIVAGVGWKSGVVGKVTLAIDSASPAGRTIQTVRPVSGWRTKAKLGVMPRKAIWFWKWSDIKALPWSWRSRRPRAASARTAPRALWTARSRAWVAAKRSAFSAACQPSASAFQCSTTTKRAMLPSSTVGITAASVPHITPGASVVMPSVVVVDRPLRAAVRREQSILAHEAEHPVTADAEAIEDAQAGPTLAVPLAGEGRAIEVAADRLEQPHIVDRRPRPSPPARGQRLGDRPGGIGGAPQAPGGANPPHAVGLAGRRGARGGHQRDLLRAKGPGR